MAAAHLTAAQRRALVLLLAAEKRYGPTPYTRPQGVHEATLDVLKRHGLVETQERPMTSVARLTGAGRTMAFVIGGET